MTNMLLMQGKLLQIYKLKVQIVKIKSLECKLSKLKIQYANYNFTISSRCNGVKKPFYFWFLILSLSTELAFGSPVGYENFKLKLVDFSKISYNFC